MSTPAAPIAWQAPGLCRTCVNLTLWKGRGYGCDAPYSKGPLNGVIVCKGYSFVEKASPDHYTSDCPMAGHQIETGLKDPKEPTHPLKLLRQAYGI